MFCVKSALLTMYEAGEMYFRLLRMNGLHLNSENERFTAASSPCHQNLKYGNFTSSFGRLCQNIAPKSVPHVQHDYFSSFGQTNQSFVPLSLPFLSSFRKALLNARNISTQHRITLFRDVATFVERAGQTHATFSAFSRQHVDVYVPRPLTHNKWI